MKKLIRRFRGEQTIDPETFMIQSKLGRLGGYGMLLLMVAIIFVPLFIILNVSFKTQQEYMNSGVYSLAESFLNFDNYIKAFQTGNFGQAFKNTGFLLIICVPVSLMIAAMVAYALGRFNFPGKKIMMLFFILPTFIPGMTVAVATFTIIKMLGLYNTIWAGVILYIGTDIMTIYIFLQYVENIPYSLDESAKLDGASRLRIFWSVILPQMRPAIATGAILKVLGIYNDFFTPYLYMPDTELKTVATALNSFAGDRMADWPLMSSAIIFVALPTIIIFLLLQKEIIGGVTNGSVKG
ncbi:carbohydrate ABC transporter permease [Enterococcus sp.]|uniref:carbohydrate ABC transporter permease n=1 Tax=Enterococcus sp. TaxID=35783 RepID=UPI003C72A5FF